MHAIDGKAKRGHPQRSGPAPKPPSGTQRMRARGLVPIHVWLRPADRDRIAAAALAVGLSLSGFLRYHALREAWAKAVG